MDPLRSSAHSYSTLGDGSNSTPHFLNRDRNENLEQQQEYHEDNNEPMDWLPVEFAPDSDQNPQIEYNPNLHNETETTTSKNKTDYLSVCSPLVDNLKKKIKHWKKKGSPLTDTTPFQDPSLLVKKDINTSNCLINLPKAVYKGLINKKVPKIEETLASKIPSEIWNWSHNQHPLNISRNILTSGFWTCELPSVNSFAKPYDTATQKEDSEVQILSTLSVYGEPISLPNIGAIKALKASLFKASPPSIFAKPKRYANYTQVPLFPATPYLQTELGYIPTHTVSANAVELKTDATNCSHCVKPFNAFQWQYNCMMCGDSNCSDCLNFKHLQDYEQPVRVCSNCEPKLIQAQSSEWVAPLEYSDARKVMTPSYVYLLDDLGFANKQKFLRWVDEFMADGRNDLAIQCNYSGKGCWITLASKFVARKQYQDAMNCLHQMNIKADEWSKHGDSLAIKSAALALMCYRKAEFTYLQFADKALEYADHPISKSSVLIGLKLLPNENFKKTFFESISKRAVNQKKYDLAIFCYALQQFPISTWVEIVNYMDITGAELCVTYMHDHFNCDWGKINLRADKDHLRWQFFSPPDFNIWLDYLIALLKISDGKNCIPYFRRHMHRVNFKIHRDKFLSQKEVTKALICHCLIPKGESWAELAKKWQSKDEAASLECYLCSLENIDSVGDRLFDEGHFSLALRCYLQANNFVRIRQKSETAEYRIRLLYQVAVWKYQIHPIDFYIHPGNILINIAQTLLSESEISNFSAVSALMIASLQSLKQEEDPLPYHKQIAQTNIYDRGLLGLLDETSLLCITDPDKKWHAALLDKFLYKFENQLRTAISECLYDHISILLDRIHPLTLTTVNKLLLEYQIDTLPRGPLKSAGLLVRSITHLIEPSSQGLMSAMNDITDAMLGDTREECLQACKETIDKIQEESTWSLSDKSITALNFPQKNEFADTLELTPKINMSTRSEEDMAKFKNLEASKACIDQLKKVIRSEENIAKLNPFDAAMSYIDLGMVLSEPAGYVGGFLNASLELLKAQKTLESTQSSSKSYAYRRAIFELVVTAVHIGKNHLCPTTHLYALRSGIAILTSAFSPFQHISTHEQLFLEDLYREVDRISQIIPLVMGRLIKIYDLIYLDMMNCKFLRAYLSEKRDSRGEKNPMHMYYIFEGISKGWLEEDKFIFEEERQRTMQAILSSKGHTMDDVEALMKWPALTRDENGWRSNKAEPLKLSSQAFSHVEGVAFNLETGEVSLLFTTSKDKMESLFDMKDVADIMKIGVTESLLTLDSPDPKMPHLPLQNMTVVPEALSDTPFTATLLQTHLLVSMFLSGTEISSKAPFAVRDADINLLQRLPENLRDKIRSLQKEVQDTAGKVHRIWIEAGELPYSVTNSENEIKYTFGKCQMNVKIHTLQYDAKGHLVQSQQDEEIDTPAAKFAKLMTDEYHSLEKYFPELARLSELVKIQALAIIAKNMDHNVITQSANVALSRKEIESTLQELREGILYPQETYENIQNKVDAFITKKNLNPNKLSNSQLNRIGSQYRQYYRTEDEKTIEQLTSMFLNAYHVQSYDDLHQYVTDWLNSDDSGNLASLLKSSSETYKKNSMLKICQTFKNAGIATQFKEYPKSDSCTWIPTITSKNILNQKVYGGIHLQTRLKDIQESNMHQGTHTNAYPPLNPTRISNTPSCELLHEVKFDMHGHIYAATSSIKDQWLQSQAASSNSKSFWKSNNN